MKNQKILCQIRSKVFEDLNDNIFHPVECKIESNIWKKVNANVFSSPAREISRRIENDTDQVRDQVHRSLYSMFES